VCKGTEAKPKGQKKTKTKHLEGKAWTFTLNIVEQRSHNDENRQKREPPDSKAASRKLTTSDFAGGIKEEKAIGEVWIALPKLEEGYPRGQMV